MISHRMRAAVLPDTFPSLHLYGTALSMATIGSTQKKIRSDSKQRKFKQTTTLNMRETYTLTVHISMFITDQRLRGEKNLVQTAKHQE